MSSLYRKFAGGGATAAAVLVLGGGQAQAVIPYQQGYETDASGWNTSNAPEATITRVPSGGGVIGAPSSTGGFHAELTNDQDAYNAAADYGQAGFTQFGGPQQNYTGDFYQAVDVYVDLATWTPPTNPSVNAFFIDAAPRNNTTNASDFRDESNIAFTVPTAGTVNVAANYSTPLATITETGWYRFFHSFETPGDTVTNSFYVVDLSDGQLLGSATLPSYQSMPSSELGGNSFMWFVGWQNGFANDVIAIDNATTGLTPVPIPEPTSLALLGLGGLAALRRRRRA